MDSSALRQLLAPFFEMRVTDVVDILVSTSIAYALIAWIRRTQAAQVAAGILMLGIVYLAARAFDLQLTAWMFQGFFAIFLVVVVVIFQEELRQLFERVATWNFRARKQTTPTLGSLDVLVQTLTDLARDRVGAIVVIPGRQPLSRHIQGGIELNGHLTLPLLKSIFDPHSPGHDGAVIVDDGRLLRFAVHLPLSKDFRQLAQAGTRHSAALGLAELTDALCIVVSEERGRISVARDGTLRVLESTQQLGQVIGDFLEEQRPTQQHNGRRLRFLRGNLGEKAASLVLVLGLWLLFVPGSRPRTESFDVPVRVINLPSDVTLEQVSPEIVQATFTGPSRAFYLLDPNNLEVTVDASLIRLGRRTFRITGDNLTHPQALALEEVRPGTVRISVHKAES
jgi:diadenylate cyclase